MGDRLGLMPVGPPTIESRRKRYGRIALAACKLITVCASAVAACLWWYASSINVSPVPGQPGITLGNIDLYPTMMTGAYWNAWAAIAAGVAAASQAIAVIVEAVGGRDR